MVLKITFRDNCFERVDDLVVFCNNNPVHLKKNKEKGCFCDDIIVEKGKCIIKFCKQNIWELPFVGYLALLPFDDSMFDDEYLPYEMQGEITLFIDKDMDVEFVLDSDKNIKYNENIIGNITSNIKTIKKWKKFYIAKSLFTLVSLLLVFSLIAIILYFKSVMWFIFVAIFFLSILSGLALFLNKSYKKFLKIFNKIKDINKT